MNALDLLVDFAALVSTPDTSTHHQDERNNPSPNSTHKAAQAPSFHAGPSGAEHFHFVEEAPRHNDACTFTADPPSPLQTFSAPPSYWHNFMAGRYDIHGGPTFYTQREDDTQWMFDRDMQQDSHLSLPYQVISVEPNARIQYEPSPAWDVRYGASYAMPSEAEMWYGPRAKQTFRSTPHSDTRFVFPPEEALSSEARCNNSICQCRRPSPQCNYSANNVRSTWDVTGSQYHLDTLHGYNERALAAGGRGEQYETRWRDWRSVS